MRYTIALFVGLVCLIGISSAFSLQEFLYPYKIYPSGTVILHDRLHGVYLIKPNRWSFVFNSAGTTAQTLLEQNSWATAVVNASYFGYSGGLFVPAGVYALDPSPIDPSYCEKDKNVCELLNLDTLSFTRFQFVVKSPTISAWPVLLNKWVIPDDVSLRYSHRQSRNYRTVILSTRRGPLFVVTKRQYTLPYLATYIHKLFGNISALNLDGWSSTTLATAETTDLFQRNSQKRLPTFFILY